MNLTVSDCFSIPFNALNCFVIQDKVLCATIDSHIFAPLTFQFTEELVPDSALVSAREVAVVDDGVYTRYESIVELADTVGGQETIIRRKTDTLSGG